MAKLFVTYWRDIPSQVTVKQGRKSAKKMLSDRFQEAIDMAAMRSGAAETDDYLAEWRRGDAIETDSVSDTIAAEHARQIEENYGPDKIKALINNGGYEA